MEAIGLFSSSPENISNCISIWQIFIQMIQWIVLRRVVLHNIRMWVFSTKQKQNKQKRSTGIREKD